MKKLLSLILFLFLFTPSWATVELTDTRVQYAGDGATTTFTYAFQIYDDDDLIVTKSDTTSLTETTLVLNTDYTVTGAGGTGGTIELTAGSVCQSGTNLTITRAIDLLQSIDLVDGEAFSAETLETGFDKLTLIAQDQAEDIGRAVLLKKSSDLSGLEMPNPAPNYAIGWDSSGTALTNMATSGGSSTVFDHIGNYTDLATAVATIGASVTTLVIDQETIISDGVTVTIPSTLSLMIINGGSIEGVAGGAVETLAFSGLDPQAELYQIYGSNLTVTGLKETYPDHWTTNAIPGTTDMGAAINSAFASVIANGLVRFSSCAGYVSSIATSCGPSIDIEMLSPIIYTGSSDITALTIGTTGVTNTRANLQLNVTRSIQSTWTSDDNIGIKLFSPNTCNIYLDNVSKFTRNVVIIGENANANYNNVFIGRIYDGQIGIDLYAATLSAVNQNTFYGGRFSVTTTVNTTSDRYGVRITSQNDAHGGDHYYNNNNVFYNPSFEMQEAHTTGDAIGILINYGSRNQVIAGRDEANDFFSQIENDSAYNIFETVYSTSSMDDNSTYQNNFMTDLRTYPTMGDRGNVIFNSGAMHKTVCEYDGATKYNIPKISFGVSTEDVDRAWSTAVTIAATYVEINSSKTIGINVDTSVKKRFILRPDVEAGYGGRVVINAYDSGGAIITTAGAVVGQEILDFTYTASYGGAFRTGGDTEHDVYFTVSDDVKSVRVAQSGGTAVLRSRGFSIVSVDGGKPAVWTGYEEVVQGTNIGTAPPAAGTWAVGRTIFQAIPTVGQPIGWMCTVTGTPGTWVALANL